MMRPGRSLGLLLGALLTLAHPAGAGTSGQQRAVAAGHGLVGSAAPRLVLTTIDGTTIDLGALYGRKAVYLKFWATWCTPCREQMPHFERTYEAAGPDLAVIAVDVGFNDSLAEIQRYRTKLGITMPIVIDDGTLAAAFRLRVTPQHIVIGRDGRIQYVGHLADARLDAALEAARNPPASAGPGSRAALDRPAAKAPGESAHVAIGDLLPATTVTTLDGRPFAFGPGKPGRPTVLVFLSPWCESYLATTRPAMSAACRGAREQVGALAADGRVRWLGIASGLWADREDLRKYQAEYTVRIPLALDESGALFRAFHVNEVPVVFVADSRGYLIRQVDTSDPQGLRKAIDAL